MMSSFSPKSFDPKEVILHRIRYLSVRGRPFVVNFDTIQISKPRVLPNHQLHCVALHDTEGKHWRITYLVNQQKDGSWRIQRSHYLPIQSNLTLNKPLLRLSVTVIPGGLNAYQDSEKVQVDNWKSLIEGWKRLQEEQKPLQEGEKILLENWKLLSKNQQTSSEDWVNSDTFYAGGDIIDNGFDILRVRLTSRNGLVLEDTVQDSLLLFSSNQRILLPMQAEFYNSLGELVSSQPVLELPSLPTELTFRGVMQ